MYVSLAFTKKPELNGTEGKISNGTSVRGKYTIMCTKNGQDLDLA